MFFFGICTLYNQFCCRMTMYGPMHLVLYHFEKLPGSLGIFVVIKRCGIEICNLLIKFSLGQTNLTNIFKLAFKIFISEHMPFFQALFVHRPSLNCIILDNLTGPFAESYGTVIVHFKANGNYCL